MSQAQRKIVLELLEEHYGEQAVEIETKLFKEHPDEYVEYSRELISKVKSDDPSDDTFWNDPVFDKYRREQRRREEDLAAGIHIEKGGTLCKACKKDSVICWLAQTRSGDEGSTQFFLCVECGKKWRV